MNSDQRDGPKAGDIEATLPICSQTVHLYNDPLAQSQTMTWKTEGTQSVSPSTMTDTKISGDTNSSGNSGNDAVKSPKIPVTTYLAVLACDLIYLAQTWCLVGAGAQAYAITTEFNAPAQTSWLTTSIAICLVVLGPICAQAADFWGRKWLMVILGSYVGAAGSLLVSRATNMRMVLAGTCLIGVSFGAQPVLHAVASEVLPRRWRGWSQGFLMFFSSVGAFVALVVGGVFSRSGSPGGFRIYFYIGAALYALAGTLLVFVYHPVPRDLQRQPVGQKLARLDWIGYGLLLSGLVLFCVGLSFMQNPYPISSPVVLAPFLIGLALMATLGVYEWRFKTDGMFHHGLFRTSRNFALTLVCLFCEGLAFYGANAYFASEITTLFLEDPLMVGINYGVAWLAAGFSCVVGGAYSSKHKKVRAITVAAFLVFTVFFALMASADAKSRQQVWGYPVFLGLGLGIVTATLVTAAQLSVPPELIASASGIIISVRSLGGSIGIPIYTAIFNSQLGRAPAAITSAVVRAGVPDDTAREFAAFISESLGRSVASASALPGITPEILDIGMTALRNTQILAYRYVWVTALPFMVIATIASYFIIDPSKEFNYRVDTPLPT